MYSTYNEGKSVLAEKLIRNLKSKIFKHMTVVSQNVYFHVSDDIVNKYNNTVHRSIKIKPIDVTSDSYAEYNEDCNEKGPRFKVGDRVKISKYKNVFAKGYTQNWSEEVFVVSKIKNTVTLAYVINNVNGEPITGNFYEKELQKNSQEKLRIEKVLKRKGDKLYFKWIGYYNSFNSWIDKKISQIIMSQYFPKPFRSFRRNIKVKVDLSIYATKDIKNIWHVVTSSFALKTNLSSVRTEVDKLHIGKLTTLPVDLSKLSTVVKNDVVKNAAYDKLATKVNNIDTSDLVLKTKFQTGKTELKKKIPDVTGFVQKTKLTELEDKIPDFSSLATKTALSSVENKIPSVSILVKKTDHGIRISEIEKKLTDHNHDEYITTPEFNTC